MALPKVLALATRHLVAVRLPWTMTPICDTHTVGDWLQ
jgi:hypothetical protein